MTNLELGQRKLDTTKTPARQHRVRLSALFTNSHLYSTWNP